MRNHESEIFPSNDNIVHLFGRVPIQFDEIFQIFCETDFFSLFLLYLWGCKENDAKYNVNWVIFDRSRVGDLPYLLSLSAQVHADKI